MDYTAPAPESAQRLLFTMATQSPRVQERLERELYRLTADSDGSTDQYIVDDAFQQLLLDLNTIGLQFTFDITDYTGNWAKLERFLAVSSYLLPNTLYPQLRTNSALLTMVRHCLDGSLGNNETLVQTYLSELGGLEGQLPVVPELTETIDEIYLQVTQTEVFTDFLRNQLELSTEENLHSSVDELRHRQYQQFLKETLARLIEAVCQFSSYPFYSELARLQQNIVHDFLAPANTLDYAYLFLENEESLPEDLHARHAQKMYHYKVSHPWCFFYHDVRSQVPSRLHQVAIACFHYALWGNTLEEYRGTTTQFRKQYPDESVDAVIASLYPPAGQ